MENSPEFRNVIEIIKSFENQLQFCAESRDILERSGLEATQYIEEHFARCLDALATRKAALLGECNEFINNQRMYSSCHLERSLSIIYNVHHCLFNPPLHSQLYFDITQH